MTTAILRPNATVSAGAGVTYTGGASWTAVTADDSDASYATLFAASTASLGLTTVTLPTGAVTKTARVRMRVRSDSGVSNPTVFLRAGSSDIASVMRAGQTTTIATVSGTTTPASITQTQISAANLWIMGGVNSTRWVELYVDLVYAEIPTCAVSTPTGASTTTSRPTVTWSHTAGSDGGSQSRYQVAIFTAAQYGIGGFDPSTSPSTYDSEGVTGTATTLDPDSLPNGTYRAYVRTAQTINGYGHWSDWAYSAFTVSVTGPVVSSVTPTAGSSTGSIAVAVARNTGGAAWEWVTVERSADSGTTWEFVRGASLAVATGNTFNITDYEAPNGTSVIYRAQATMTDAGTGALKEGAWVSSSSTSWTHVRPWVKTISNSTLNTVADLAEAPEFEYPRRVGVFDVLGAEHPVTVSDVAQARRGTVVLQTESTAERTALKATLDSDMPVLVQFPSTFGIDQGWFAVTGYNCRHLDPMFSTNGTRRWNLAVVEVDRPPDAS